MCGAGILPARMADEARRQGWRVVAFAFEGAADLRAHADRVVPSRLTEGGPVLAALQAEGIRAVLFAGGFGLGPLVRTDLDEADDAARRVAARAGSRLDLDLVQGVTAVLADLGVEVLDQRPFLGDLEAGPRCWTRRQPTGGEWTEVRRGLALARTVAGAGIGQTVVLRHGVVTAVEALEGTTETVRRGLALAGADAIIVKAVAPGHDYRFDTPTVGPETVRAAAQGRAAVLAVEAGRVLVLDLPASIGMADAAGLALVSADAGG